MRKIKVALINPRGFDIKQYLPISLAYLKANLDDEGFDVKIIDCSLWGINLLSQELKKELQNFDPHILGVTAWSCVYKEALAIIQLAKSILPEVITIIGGPHATSYYNNVMENKEIDFLFRGEAELSFPLFLKRMKENNSVYDIKGLVYRNKTGKLIANEPVMVDNLDVIKMPNYDDIDLDKYIENGYRYAHHSGRERVAPILTTRGCPYRCQFCSAPQLTGKLVRKHSPEYVIRWIKHLYKKGIQHINIIDDNFTFDVAYAKKICRGIISLNLKDLSFGTPNGIRMQRGDAELWNLMKKAGWNTLVVAPESGSQRMLKIMEKDLNLGIVPGIVNEIKKARLGVVGFFIIGYPGETKQDLLCTRNFAVKTNFDFVVLHKFQPLPGTPVFDALIKKGEIQSDFLPADMATANLGYLNPTLEGYNLQRFVLVTYMYMCFFRPKRIVYLLKQFGTTHILRGLKKMILHLKAKAFLRVQNTQSGIF